MVTDRYIEVISSHTVIYHTSSIVVSIVLNTPAFLKQVRLEKGASFFSLLGHLQVKIVRYKYSSGKIIFFAAFIIHVYQRQTPEDSLNKDDTTCLIVHTEHKGYSVSHYL